MVSTYFVSESATPDDFVIALIHPLPTQKRTASKFRGTSSASASSNPKRGFTLFRYCQVAGTVLDVHSRFESDPYYLAHLESSQKYGRDSLYVTFRSVSPDEYVRYERIVKRWYTRQVFGTIKKG